MSENPEFHEHYPSKQEWTQRHAMLFGRAFVDLAFPASDQFLEQHINLPGTTVILKSSDQSGVRQVDMYLKQGGKTRDEGWLWYMEEKPQDVDGISTRIVGGSFREKLKVTTEEQRRTETNDYGEYSVELLEFIGMTDDEACQAVANQTGDRVWRRIDSKNERIVNWLESRGFEPDQLIDQGSRGDFVKEFRPVGEIGIRRGDQDG